MFMPTYTYINKVNEHLKDADQYTNARYICNYLLTKKTGWTLNSICGMLGNFQSESLMNPNIVEISQQDRWDNWGNYGYGLPQWTPWYTRQNNQGKWIDPANYHGTGHPTFGYWAEQRGYTTNKTDGGTVGGMDVQLDFLDLGEGGWDNKTEYYAMTWPEYKASTWDAAELARVFYRNYERSASGSYGSRPDQAESWYNRLYDEFGGGVTPPTPTTFNWKAGGRRWQLLRRIVISK